MKTRTSFQRIALLLILFLYAQPNAGAQTITEFLIATGTDTCFAITAAYNGDTYLLPIVGDNTGRYSLTTQMVSTSGNSIGERISLGTQAMPGAVAASDSSGFLVCWNDLETRLWGRLISAAGTPAGDPFLIAPYGWIGNNSLTFGGSSYCVLYEDTLATPGHVRLIYAKFISRSGIAGGAVQVSVAEGFLDGGLAFDGVNFLATWRGGGANVPTVYGRFINSVGAAVGGAFVIDDSPYKSDNPVSATFDGSRYLVLFSDEVDGNSEIWHVYGRFVTPSGQVQERIAIAENGNYNFGFSAFSSTSYLVTYHHFIDLMSGEVYLRGRYFDTAGAPAGDEFTIASPAGGKIPIGSVLFFDGTNFLVGVNRVVLQVDDDGDYEFTNGDVYGCLVSPPPTGVDENHSSLLPEGYTLGQNFPNPFNPVTVIPYQIAETADVTLSIFNVLGVEVMRYEQTAVTSGAHTVSWHGLDHDGNRVPAGVYGYRLTVATAAGTWSQTKKMIVLK